MNTPVTVAIIDRGIDVNKIANQPFSFEEVFCSPTARVKSDDDQLTHGTNIAGIICHFVDRVNLLSIRVSEKPTVQELVDALEICAQRTDIDVINISLGIRTGKPISGLEDVCRRCFDSGKVIVAASHFDLSLPCLPADYDFVYSVGSGWIADSRSFCYRPNSRVKLLTKGVYQKLIGIDGRPSLLEGSSYSAAIASGIILSYFSKVGSRDLLEVEQLLLQNSVKCPALHSEGDDDESSLETIRIQDGDLIFPSDDWRLVNLLEPKLKNIKVLRYPIDPEGIFFSSWPTNILQIPGIVSKKLLKSAKRVVIGNFLLNPILANRLFGYWLMRNCMLSGSELVFLDRQISGSAGYLGDESGRMVDDAGVVNRD